MSRHPRRGGGNAFLDRLLQLGVEPAHLRVLQQGLPGGVQGHATVRASLLLRLLEEPSEVPLAPGRAGVQGRKTLMVKKGRNERAFAFGKNKGFWMLMIENLENNLFFIQIIIKSLVLW